ncbi:CoA ester lyase [Sphingobium lactosutens]|uniref:HpcH/HpaI aldolase/citrate lyase family protein n=1 Tax=Sphingobium lactosutens TaxID=522773 RepID=UPI0015B9D1FF|nr:CoA ester lyase [Sphingobium lactosutens]NWK97484.1 CoA ester lyase [Sphingobium lactosutens]
MVSDDIACATTFLFVPGDRPQLVGKALTSDAAFLIVDLEDAVDSTRKHHAREAIAQLSPDPRIGIRINPWGTPDWEKDIALLQHCSPSFLVPTKCESADELHELHGRIGRKMNLLPLIETARAVDRLTDIGQVEGVVRLCFGSIDMALDLDCDDDWEPLGWIRSQLVWASRVSGLAGPVDGVTVELNDDEKLTAAASAARRWGFRGKLLIHPRQVSIAAAAFQPSRKELDWARSIVADVSGDGARAIGGQMIDRPVIARARRLLREQERNRVSPSNQAGAP